MLDYLFMALAGLAGAVGSILVHELGHVLALEYTGVRWRRAGFHFDWRVSDPAHGLLISRAGFFFQISVGLVLCWVGGVFGVGYGVAGVVHVLGYPARHAQGGDLNMIDKFGGDGSRDWRIFCLAAGVMALTAVIRHAGLW